MSCPNCRVKERTEEEKKNLINRMNRIIGSMNGIKDMINNDRYCDDILIQLSAADKAIKSLAAVILDNHMHSCVLDGIKEGDLTLPE